MKKILLSTICLLLSVVFYTQLSFAQTLIVPNVWSGSGASTTTAATPSNFSTLPATTTPGAARVTVSQWYRHTPITGTAAGACYDCSNWETGGTLAAAQASGKYIYFTITNDNTTELAITGVTLQSQVSGTGPNTVQMQYDKGAGDVNFGAAITGYATATPIRLAFAVSMFAPVILCPSQSVTFKVYAWGAGTAAGTLRINDNDTLNAYFVNAMTLTATATPNPACAGQNITLSRTIAGGPPGGHTYLWTGPGTITPPTSSTATINAAPTSASGIYTLTATDGWGCSIAATTPSVVINPSPSPAVSPSGTVTVCSFDSVILSATAGAGLTYQWDTGAFATPYAIPGATNINYTAHWAGRYRVTVSNGTCSALTTPPTYVVLKAAASSTVTASGSLAFCTGGSVTLTAASGAGYTYQWYDGGVAMAGVTTAAYTATTSGNYSVHITVPSGCVTQSAVFVVVEVSLPTISTSDTTTFCQGGSARLIVNISAAATGVQFQWKRNTVNIPGATTTSYIVTSSGDYTCFVNIPGSCAITTNDILVTVHPSPSPLITFNSSTSQFSTYNYYTHYQWYLNTVVIAGATTRTATAHYNGSYRVMVTDTFGCTKLSDAYGLYNLAVNNTITQADIKIYPNPATDMVHIEASATIKTTVSSIEGKVILYNDSNKDINIAILPNGLYLITVYDMDGNRLLVEKLVKE